MLHFRYIGCSCNSSGGATTIHVGPALTAVFQDSQLSGVIEESTQESISNLGLSGSIEDSISGAVADVPLGGDIDE
jgi:hypothetical protein